MNPTALKATRVLDFGLAAASLLYGLYTNSMLWIAGGLLGFALAWINPTKIVRDYVFKKAQRPGDVRITSSSKFPTPPARPYSRHAR